jgi:hypothetical protein
MKKLSIIILLLSSMIFGEVIKSPNGNLTLTFNLSSKGEPRYALSYLGKEVIKISKLGLMFKEGGSFNDSFEILKIDTTSVNENWEPVWGEVRSINNNYNELKVTLAQSNVEDRVVTGNRILIIVFRLFNDGLGFRYEIPEQEHLKNIIVGEELTQFALTGNHKAFWIPGDFYTNEYRYSTTNISDINALIGREDSEIGSKSIIGDNFVQTPLLLKSADNLYISIFEAALVNYPAMQLKVDREKFVLSAQLVPDALGNMAYFQTPAKTPWRTIIVSNKAEDILSSKLILNLNEPSKIKNTEFIKPMKYVGIWWEMHVGVSSWNYADMSVPNLKAVDWGKVKPNGRHGATTERTKRYIDFASEHGFKGVLIEGWNIGWEDWGSFYREDVFDFVTPYPDFDIDYLTKYAKSKNVELIMHHETSASVSNYERRMDEAYRFMKKYGYNAVKTGYVGWIIPRGEHHDGQWMVNHYVRVAEKTAENEIMLCAHEPVRPTGLHRTYPNWMACEAARGNEFNAWSKGNKPEHETILPFTRLMGGPMDYTPGIFQIKLDIYGKKEQIHTTLAKQLALYVTMYSPLQMAADIPENYEKHLDAFQFIKDVPVDWDDTKIINAEPGDYITIARKEKNKDNWFIGSITDENEREFKVNLDFLDKDKIYTAKIYQDSKDADWEKNPMAYEIIAKKVKYGDILNIKLAKGGGAAISLIRD